MKRKGAIRRPSFLFAACVFLMALRACVQPAPPGVPQGEVPGKEEAPEGKEEEQQDQDQNPSARMTGILISSPPETLYYAINQPFDETGLIVEGLYDNGTSRILEAGEYTLSAVDTSISRPLRVTVLAGTFSATFPILVNNSSSVLQSISASAPGGVVVRELGKPLGTEGITVTGHYNDGNRALDMFSVRGYDRAKRGIQTVTLAVNGKTAPLTVRVKVPAAAELGALILGTNADPRYGHNTAFIRGQSLGLANARFQATVRCNNVTAVLVSGDGIDIDTDIQDFNPNTPGKQQITLNLDEKSVTLGVYVADIAPEIYFDYGFMRHQGDPQGLGGAAVSGRTEGSYYTPPGKPLVLSPVRVLIGYDRDNNDLGVSYSWTVTPLDGSPALNPSSGGGEFFTISPQTAGTWELSVTVTGRNFITGSPVSNTATTKVISGAGSPSAGNTNWSRLPNYAPGQFTEAGTGHTWSLGAFGGYLMLPVSHKTEYRIEGNGFEGWAEPGVVWFQEDQNGNDLPDEMWYELDVGRESHITRRYSLTYFKYGDGSTTNEYDQIIREIYWVDGKGRTGQINGGWPWEWGVSNADGVWVTYTGTNINDNGHIRTEFYSSSWPNCVDAAQELFSVSGAVAADGSSVSLSNVRFLKVHTGVFKYGGIFGDQSTEITLIDWLRLSSWGSTN
jgi:hypothetical protein